MLSGFVTERVKIGTETFKLDEVALLSSEITRDFFQVHPVVKVEFRSEEPVDIANMVMEVNETKWVSSTYDSWKENEGGSRYYVVEFIPEAVVKLPSAPIDSVQKLRREAGLLVAPPAPFNENLEFEIGVKGLDLGKIAYLQRADVFDRIMDTDNTFKMIHSKDNLFLYFDGNAVLAAKYQSLFSNVVLELPEGIDELGADIKLCDTGNYNAHWFFGALQDHPLSYDKHAEVFFDKRITIATDAVFNPFRAYAFDFGDETIPKGNYFLYQQRINAKSTPRMQNFFGVIE